MQLEIRPPERLNLQKGARDEQETDFRLRTVHDAGKRRLRKRGCGKSFGTLLQQTGLLVLRLRAQYGASGRSGDPVADGLGRFLILAVIMFGIIDSIKPKKFNLVSG